MTYKENVKAILECYFTGFKDEIIDSACSRILEQEPCGDAISRQAVIDAIEDDNRNGHYSCFASNNDAQCFKDVIRSLPSVTQEPCDDAISRQAVLDLCDSKDPDYKVIHFKEDVECLPSVYPTKTGHWLPIDDTPHEEFECSRCGYYVRTAAALTLPDIEYNICPGCGSRMIGSEGHQ